MEVGIDPEDSGLVFDLMAGYAGGEVLAGGIGTTAKTVKGLRTPVNLMQQYSRYDDLATNTSPSQLIKSLEKNG